MTWATLHWSRVRIHIMLSAWFSHQTFEPAMSFRPNYVCLRWSSVRIHEFRRASIWITSFCRSSNREPTFFAPLSHTQQSIPVYLQQQQKLPLWDWNVDFVAGALPRCCRVRVIVVHKRSQLTHHKLRTAPTISTQLKIILRLFKIRK